jgi:predicted HD superfamily hydrolase involved in NAD metabolism
MKTNNDDIEKSALLAESKTAEIEKYLKSKLTPERYAHVLSVRELALDLAKKYGADLQKVNLAALLHDCAKWMSTSDLYEAAANHRIQLDEVEHHNPSLVHAPIGALLAVSHFDVDNPEILNAIRLHTTGATGMTLIDKILYVADFAEPKRNYAEAHSVREIAYQNLNEAVFEVSRYKIEHLLAKGVLIHPHTIDAYNSALREISEPTRKQ